MVDCTISWGNNGCSGGLVEYAYHYLESNYVITEAEYPYNGQNNKCASESKTSELFNVADFKEVERFSPEQLAQAMTQNPVSVGVDASDMAFKFYKKGIIKKRCGDTIDHAVLAVGYGTDNGTDYWLVKNSWNEEWGDNGYFKIARGTDECGIEDDVTGIQFKQAWLWKETARPSVERAYTTRLLKSS